MSNRFRQSYVALALVVAFIACGHTSTAIDNESIAGTYHLVTYLGGTLPAVYLETDTDTLTLQSGTLVVADSGTFTEQRALRVHRGGVNDYSIVNSLSGTWVRNGTSFLFTWDAVMGVQFNSTFTGTFTGSGFQFVNASGNNVFTYTK